MKPHSNDWKILQNFSIAWFNYYKFLESTPAREACLRGEEGLESTATAFSARGEYKFEKYVLDRDFHIPVFHSPIRHPNFTIEGVFYYIINSWIIEGTK